MNLMGEKLLLQLAKLYSFTLAISFSWDPSASASLSSSQENAPLLGVIIFLWSLDVVCPAWHCLMLVVADLQDLWAVDSSSKAYGSVWSLFVCVCSWVLDMVMVKVLCTKLFWWSDSSAFVNRYFLFERMDLDWACFCCDFFWISSTSRFSKDSSDSLYDFGCLFRKFLEGGTELSSSFLCSAVAGMAFKSVDFAVSCLLHNFSWFGFDLFSWKEYFKCFVFPLVFSAVLYWCFSAPGSCWAANWSSSKSPLSNWNVGFLDLFWVLLPCAPCSWLCASLLADARGEGFRGVSLGVSSSNR